MLINSMGILPFKTVPVRLNLATLSFKNRRKKGTVQRKLTGDENRLEWKEFSYSVFDFDPKAKEYATSGALFWDIFLKGVSYDR